MNSKKSEIYRRNARKKAIIILNKKRKLKPPVESDDVEDNLLDAETIPYVEPYRDSSKKDEIYRRKAKKRAIKILTKPLYNKESREKRKRKADKELVDITDDVVDGDTYSDAETIPYAEPYRATSKNDEIYRRKAKKKAIKILN